MERPLTAWKIKSSLKLKMVLFKDGQGIALQHRENVSAQTNYILRKIETCHTISQGGTLNWYDIKFHLNSSNNNPIEPKHCKTSSVTPNVSCVPSPSSPSSLPPDPSFLLLPPLEIPSTSEAEITRFRVFAYSKQKRDRPSYRDAWTHLKLGTMLHSIQEASYSWVITPILKHKNCSKESSWRN